MLVLEAETDDQGLIAKKNCSNCRSTFRTAPRKTPERSRFSTRRAAAGTSCSTASPCCWSSTRKPTTTPTWAEALQADYPTKDDSAAGCPRSDPAAQPARHRHRPAGSPDRRPCPLAAVPAGYQEMGLKKDRPPITKSNIVCAEPMPGEKELLDEFLKTLRDDHLEALIRQVMQVPEGTRVRATKAMADSLSDLVRTVWEKMRLAGEAGSLLKIEEELAGRHSPGTGGVGGTATPLPLHRVWTGGGAERAAASGSCRAMSKEKGRLLGQGREPGATGARRIRRVRIRREDGSSASCSWRMPSRGSGSWTSAASVSTWCS